MNKPDSARYYFNLAETKITEFKNYRTSVTLLREKAKLEEKLSNLDNSIELYRRIQKIAKEKNNTQIYIDVLIDEGRTLLKKSNLDAVNPIITELSGLDLSLLDFSEIVKGKTLQANYYNHIDETEKAYNILKPVLHQIVERARSSTELQSGFWTVEEEYLEAFDVFVNLLIDTGRYGEAVLALDQLKTINNTAFYQDPMVKSSQLNEAELTQYQNLTKQLDYLRKELLSAGPERQDHINNRIDRLNAKKRSLDRKISQYADQPSVTMHQVQQRLTSNDLLLHVTELNDTYYIARISRRNIEFQQLELNEANRTLFEESIQQLAEGKTDLKNLREISGLLQTEQFSSSAENFIMVPDSYLFQLPLDILPISEPATSYSYGGTKYLIELYTTEYLTSLQELVHGRNRDRSYKYDYAGFGITAFEEESNRADLMPLPYASREISLISDELTNLRRQRTLIEEQSTEDAFRRVAPNARILHLATHSKVSERDPLFSTIYMSGSQSDSVSENGQFTNQIFAYELFEMNLNNELIMLNSCESGSGSYLQGSGIIGISRALRYAGAESLVLNLWSVNDMMASDFAVQFYEAINRGASKSEALRSAKMHFLRQKNANPHYWGPYMLIGSSRPVVQPDRTANIMVASSFMFYLIIMVGLSYLVQQRKNRP
ncbi:MAG: CHAT domain-containing protein [Balneolaceae bacterium]|nr:CHAT domain-containing protein [Balneolaceae bacterium]